MFFGAKAPSYGLPKWDLQTYFCHACRVPARPITSITCLMLTALSRSHRLLSGPSRFSRVTTLSKQPGEGRPRVRKLFVSTSHAKWTGGSRTDGEPGVLRR